MIRCHETYSVKANFVPLSGIIITVEAAAQGDDVAACAMDVASMSIGSLSSVGASRSAPIRVILWRRS